MKKNRVPGDRGTGTCERKADQVKRVYLVDVEITGKTLLVEGAVMRAVVALVLSILPVEMHSQLTGGQLVTTPVVMVCMQYARWQQGYAKNQ